MSVELAGITDSGKPKFLYEKPVSLPHHGLHVEGKFEVVE